MTIGIFLQIIGTGFICFLLGYYYSIKKQNDEIDRRIEEDDENLVTIDVHEKCVSKEWLQARISSIYNEIRGINKKMKTNELNQ